jgi:hypothetical protein
MVLSSSAGSIISPVLAARRALRKDVMLRSRVQTIYISFGDISWHSSVAVWHLRAGALYTTMLASAKCSVLSQRSNAVLAPWHLINRNLDSLLSPFSDQLYDTMHKGRPRNTERKVAYEPLSIPK